MDTKVISGKHFGEACPYREGIYPHANQSIDSDRTRSARWNYNLRAFISFLEQSVLKKKTKDKSVAQFAFENHYPNTRAIIDIVIVNFEFEFQALNRNRYTSLKY